MRVLSIIFLSGLVIFLACSAPEAPQQKQAPEMYSIRKVFRTQSLGQLPDSLALVFPNPYNHNNGDTSVTIFFTLSDTGEAKIIIQNPIGDSVVVFRDSILLPGSYSGFWNPVNAKGERLRSGLYFITLHIAPNDPARNYINSELLDIESNE